VKRQKGRKPSAVAPAKARALPGWTFPAIISICAAIFYWIPLTFSSASIQWDAADMHYPLQKYFSEHLRAGGLPFWTPYLFSGYPFLANPEAAAWYPPHWIFFLTAITPGVVQLEIALHALIACLGTYFLLSELGLRRSAALLGSLAYGLSGFFAAHSSHVGLFCAAAWLPWLLAAYERATVRRTIRYTVLGALAGGMMILAGYFQTALYGFLALGLYVLSSLWGHRDRRLRSLLILGGMLAGAAALAAIEALPGLELTTHSIRAAAEYSGSTEGILHLRPLLTLLAPDALGAISGHYSGPADVTQYYFYSGLLLLPLAVLGAIRTRMRLPALALLIPALWYFAGPAGGLYRLGGLLPGLHKVRAPIQGWFIVALALAMLAGAGADSIFGRWRAAAIPIVLVALLFADVWYWNSFKNPLAYARRSFAELYGVREAFAWKLAATQPPLTRFDGPRAFPRLGPLDHPLDIQLETTYGYFALEPTLSDEYANAMLRNPKLRDGLNVSRYANLGTGALDTNPAALPRAYFPKTIADVAGEEASRKALETLDPAAGSVVLDPHPPMRQDAAAVASVEAYDEQSYRIRYQAASPSLLKLSESWYPGWRAFLGSHEIPVLRVDHALMGAVVPGGSGEVRFEFHSRYFRYGVAISLAALLAAVVALVQGAH
jgi:hypothetical protein